MLLHGDSVDQTELLKAIGFGIVLLVFFGCAVLGAFWYSGPLVLGTEINTNGLVEYLCLGRGCEFGAPMDW